MEVSRQYDATIGISFQGSIQLMSEQREWKEKDGHYDSHRVTSRHRKQPLFIVTNHIIFTLY